MPLAMEYTNHVVRFDTNFAQMILGSRHGKHLFSLYSSSFKDS